MFRCSPLASLLHIGVHHLKSYPAEYWLPPQLCIIISLYAEINFQLILKTIFAKSIRYNMVMNIN